MEAPRVGTLDDARFWIVVMHRRSCNDARAIGELYGRIAWLARPWWRRAFRTPPWLRF